MKLVRAIVRTVCLDHVVKSLEEAGFKELTISEVKGVGDEARMNKPFTIHNKIEIILRDEEAEAAANINLEHTRTGLAGDGILFVVPLDYAVKIRTKERLG